MSHANARLTPAGRLLMVRRIEAGMPQAHVARQMGLSRGTVAKWWSRWCAEGEAGLVDRSSRFHRSPRRTSARVEERVCRLRRSTRRGPVYRCQGLPELTRDCQEYRGFPAGREGSPRTGVVTTPASSV